MVCGGGWWFTDISDRCSKLYEDSPELPLQPCSLAVYAQNILLQCEARWSLRNIYFFHFSEYRAGKSVKQVINFELPKTAIGISAGDMEYIDVRWGLALQCLHYYSYNKIYLAIIIITQVLRSKQPYYVVWKHEYVGFLKAHMGSHR